MARLFIALVFVSGLALPGLLLAGDRDIATAHVASGEKSYKAGDYPTAKSMCERALQADNTFPAAHFLLGQTLEALNQPREALRSYQNAADFARKEGNQALISRAVDAAKKLGPGLVELIQADQKLVEKLLALGDRALADEQYDTARQALSSALALQPDNEKAREGLQQTEKAILARGDPVKSRIAAAAMSEVWYYVGTGNKEKARQMATDVASKFGILAAGKDAAKLLASNFDLSKTISQEIAMAKQELVEKQKKIAARPPPPPAAAPPAGTPTPAKTTPVQTAARVDVDGTEKAAQEDSRKLSKDKLAAAYTELYNKGKDSYSKATPGAEGNQKNLAAALEQFIRCESIYMRLEAENLLTPEIEEQQKQASMLRYACMKMTILSH